MAAHRTGKAASMSTSTVLLDTGSLDVGSRSRVLALALLIVLAAESIGSFTIAAGPGQIVLLPLLWALLLGCAVGLAKDYLPRALKMDAGSQWYASAVLQSALLLFIAKLGLLVGASHRRYLLPDTRSCFRNSAISSAPWSSDCRSHSCSASDE